MQRSLRQLGDPILRQICSPVENTAEILPILDNMAEILRATPKGAALAAPQIGCSKRFVLIKTRHQIIELINPRIVNKYGRQKARESCLSIPGITGVLTRYKHVTVKALDRTDAEITINASGFLARCIQHELDHLDGILFIDHVPPGDLYEELTKTPLDISHIIEVAGPRTSEST